MARLLKWYDLCWPTTRLVLLAAREPREKTQLPGHSLGRLPAEVIKGSWDLRGTMGHHGAPWGTMGHRCLTDQKGVMGVTWFSDVKEYHVLRH